MKPNRKKNRKFRLSVLERLVDLNPDVENESSGANSVDVEGYLSNVRNDLHLLLNSRRYYGDEELDGYDEVKRSILTYGFPDLTSCTVPNSETQFQLARAIEQTIRRFEPRVTRLHVEPLETTGDVVGIQFRVDASIRAEPAPVRIVFDTVLNLDRNEYTLGDFR